MVKQIVILGAGLTGLSTAWFLKKYAREPLNVTVLEEQAFVGGWIQTDIHNDFLFERGPRGFRPSGLGEATLDLVEQLGLQTEIIGANLNAKQRFIYSDQKLNPLPKKLYKIPFSPAMRGWVGALWRDLNAKKGTDEDESIEEFFLRRLGEKWTDGLIDPVVTGIFAGDIRKLSLRSCFPFLFEWEQKHRSLIKAAFLEGRSENLSQNPFHIHCRKYPLISFKNGMNTLTHELARQVEAQIYLNETVSGIQFQKEGVCITTVQGKTWLADEVISTLPAFRLAPLLPLEEKESNDLLNTIPYSSLITVNVGFNTNVLTSHGFGYLIPSKEKKEILGCVWDSSVFPQQNLKGDQTRMTFMLGGSRQPDILQKNDHDINALIINTLREDLGIDREPDVLRIHRAKQCIPQYLVGHRSHLEALERHLKDNPRLFLIGSVKGCAVNDCIHQSRSFCIQRFMQE